jgi:hypothetical protein
MLSCGATAAEAATVGFSGTATNTNGPPQPDASCSPLLRIAFGPAGTQGTSNFGNFQYTQSHCTTGGPGPYSGGAFTYSFAAGDGFSGVYSGVASPSGTAGLLNNVINLVVTGGTGRFVGGSGAIQGVGTVDFRMGAPTQILALTGQLDLPAIPEPAVWTSMILGFGAIGAMGRRRATAPALAV